MAHNRPAETRLLPFSYFWNCWKLTPILAARVFCDSPPPTRCRLPSPGLVEKDWHVVKALAAIAAVDPGGFRFVVGGGTALSRAYKLTKRMSEDVDLKIVCDTAPSRGALRRLRNDITDALLAAGFEFDPENEKHRVSMYKGHYTKYMLPYKPLTQVKGLRPDVQIETSVWPLRRDAVDKGPNSSLHGSWGQPFPHCRPRQIIRRR
jgi:hypothetical protein